MKVLLDTHAFIWWDSAPDKLSPRARATCQDRTNFLLFSVASAWEMQIKLQLDKVTVQPVKTEITPPLAIPSHGQEGETGRLRRAERLHERQ